MYETKLDTAGMPWTTTGWAGVSMKLLQKVEATGGMVGMMQMAAGASIPRHRHTHTDQTVLVMEGDLVDEGVRYGPGSFLVAKAGTAHGPHGTVGGCVLLTMYWGPPDLVPVEEGQG